MPAMFTPYQVDYSVKNTSKTFGFSKKRVSFKFGVANNEALDSGLTGANCRGSEHEVIFVWSLNSGKRQILADGKDVHFSESGQNGWTSDQVFQHHFNLRVPNFSQPVRCHLITQPANKDVPSIRPFDLRVNGISFFGFSKIFQLGTASMVSRPMKGTSRGGGTAAASDNDPYMSPEERKAIAAAKLASIRDMRKQEEKKNPSNDDGNLINFFDDPAPPVPAQAPVQQTYSSGGAMNSFGAPPQGAPPPASYAQSSYSNYSLGQPPPPQPYGQPPPAAPAPYGQPGYLQQQPQTPVYTGAPPPQQYYQQPLATPQSQPAFGTNALTSPTNQSAVSYGSAPTFAMPPQQQQQYQQQQPMYPPQQQYPQY
jgi:hypothetical protein